MERGYIERCILLRERTRDDDIFMCMFMWIFINDHHFMSYHKTSFLLIDGNAIKCFLSVRIERNYWKDEAEVKTIKMHRLKTNFK